MSEPANLKGLGPEHAAAMEKQQPVGLVLTAVATILLVASLGQTIVTTAIPTIVGELGGLEYLTWVITAYLLASTVGAPIYGKMGDLYGRKIVLQVAVIIFLAGSIVCGIAQDMTVLVIGRAIQGLGGGGLMVVALAVVADVLPARERGKFQGILGGVFGVSTVVGPLIGGFLVEHLSWHWIFFVNLPIGVAALAVLAVALKKSGRRVKHTIDYAGAALLAALLSSIVLAASLGGGTFAWSSAPIITLGVVAILSFAGFLIVEARAPEPILPLSLFRINNFTISNSVGLIIGIAMFGSITFMPLYLQVVKGISPTNSGLMLLPMMIGLLGASTISGRIMSRTGRYRWMPVASTLSLALGMGLLTTLSPQTEIWQVMIFMFITGLGIGPVMSIGVTVVQNAVPVATLGVATASVNMFRLIGGAIGTSVFGAIFSAGLATSLIGVMPSGMPGGGVRSMSADMVAQLSDELKQDVLEAFSNALHPIFLIGVVLALIAFGLSLLLQEIPLSETLHKSDPESPASDVGSGVSQSATASAGVLGK